MTRMHVVTTRVVDPETDAVSFTTTEVPFTADEEAAADVADAAAAAFVPPSVTPYQARKALNDAGLRDTVEAAVSAAPLNVQDAWHYATVVERGSPMIAALSGALGLTSDTVDALFRAAAKVT